MGEKRKYSHGEKPQYISNSQTNHRNMTLLWTPVLLPPRQKQFNDNKNSPNYSRQSIGATLRKLAVWEKLTIYSSEREIKADIKILQKQRTDNNRVDFFFFTFFLFPGLFSHVGGIALCSQKSNLPAEATNYLWSRPKMVPAARRVYQVAFGCELHQIPLFGKSSSQPAEMKKNKEEVG